MQPHTSYLIWATPRSGSYLLCEALIRTRLAGYPIEYFGPRQTEAIMNHLNTSNYKKCLAWIMAQGITPNGVFGAKVIWNFQAEFVRLLREALGHEELSAHEIPSTAFPNLHYVWITRRDKVRQAISYWKAIKTGTWIDTGMSQSSEATLSKQQEGASSQEEINAYRPVAVQETPFDYDAIEGLRCYLEQCEAELQQYFVTCGIQPFKVVYEDFVEAYEETVLQLLTYLQIPTTEKLSFQGMRTLKKQANEQQSEEWLQRYYQLKRAEEATKQGIQTMQEHAARRYIQANVRPPDPGEVDWAAKPLPFKLYRTCEQIPLSHDTINGGTETAHIGQMLLDLYGLTRQCQSTALFHPMLKYLPREETGARPFYTSLLRPVPSGGALFPCELYLLVGAGQELPAGIYHYDVAHHALDILVQGDATALLQSALAHPGAMPPTYTFLLSSYFWKDGFKYGAFSYRLQGLDIGTVISQSEIIGHHEGLSTTIRYQFQDNVLNDLLGLDPLHESVYAVIEWRQTHPRRDSVPPCPSTLANTDFVGSHGQGADTAVLLRTSGGISPYLNKDGTEPVPNATASIARWPLPEEVHRASLIETREAFRPLHSLAPIQPPQRGENETLLLSVAVPLDLWEARAQRRSAAGTFLPRPLTKRQLSQLLLMSMRGTTNDLDGRTDFLQHTLLYCVVYRVEGVPAGVYRYQPEKHALAAVRPELRPYEVYLGRGMPNVNLFYMSVSLFPVGNYMSGFQVYGDRWYRMQNMEAGIIAQRLYLAAAAQNLGCRASLGFAVPQINKLLGLPDAKDDTNEYQYTSLMQLMIAPEYSAYQQYEQSLLI